MSKQVSFSNRETMWWKSDGNSCCGWIGWGFNSMQCNIAKHNVIQHRSNGGGHCGRITWGSKVSQCQSDNSGYLGRIGKEYEAMQWHWSLWQYPVGRQPNNESPHAIPMAASLHLSLSSSTIAYSVISPYQLPSWLLPTCWLNASNCSPCLSVCALIDPVVSCGSGNFSIGVAVILTANSIWSLMEKSIRRSIRSPTSSPTKKLTLYRQVAFPSFCSANLRNVDHDMILPFGCNQFSPSPNSN